MKKIVVGKPIETYAVINHENITEIETREIIEQIKIGQDHFIRVILDEEDRVYGLGENLRNMNRRGRIYESFCTDEPNQTPEKKALYGAHNLVIIEGAVNFGLYIDHPGRVIFDIGYTEKNEIVISFEKFDYNLFIIEGKNVKEIVKTFRQSIGKSYVPPKWAFGFQQSRWSYPNKSTVLEIADQFVENDIPCDCIYLDIDYMKDFKNFTIDEENFPDFKGFVGEMKEKGFRLIPIIDAGCKIEKGYNIYEEGIKNNYYCMDELSKPFVGAVWPGQVHFPDFLNPDARKWFGNQYKFLINQGIDGFWNDMNEPAIFYSQEGLNSAIDMAIESKGKNLGVYPYFNLIKTFADIANNPKDYKRFYHRIDGEMVNHYDVHNLYGYNMTKAADESFSDLYPNKRFLLFSRASSVGMHRHGGIWTGDNHSWWEHILLNIKMMPSLNMVGLLYSGADIGGFGGNANSDLLIRWMQFGLFTPLFRNHAVMDSRMQEPFSFDDETTHVLREVVRLRYALIPYLYSEFMKAVRDDESYFNPLFFEYDSEMSRRVEDQLLLGDSVMLAPIYEPNCRGRYVYLPEEMLLWRARNYNKIEAEVMKEGHHYMDIESDQVPIFIRKNKLLVVGNYSNNVETIDNSIIQVVGLVDNFAMYTLYDDDGSTKDYKNSDYTEIEIHIIRKEKNIEISVNNKSNKGIKKMNYMIYDLEGNVEEGEIYV